MEGLPGLTFPSFLMEDQLRKFAGLKENPYELRVIPIAK